MPSKVILCTAGYDHCIKFWEAPTGVCYRTIPYPDPCQVNKLEITPDGAQLAAAGNPTVRLFDVATTNPSSLATFEGHTTNITGMGFKSDGKWMYTASEDGTVRIWDTKAQGCKREYDIGSPVNAIALHPNQADLIVGTQSGRLAICDLGSNKVTKVAPELVPSGEHAIRSVTVSAD